MLSLLNNSFNSRPRLGIPLLGQGKLAFDQQGQDDSDPLAEHADQPIPSGAFRASLVNVGGRQMRHGLLGPLVVVALPAPCSIHIRRAYQAAAAAWGRQVGQDLPAILVSLGPAGQQRACQATLRLAGKGHAPALPSAAHSRDELPERLGPIPALGAEFAQPCHAHHWVPAQGDNLLEQPPCIQATIGHYGDRPGGIDLVGQPVQQLQPLGVPGMRSVAPEDLSGDRDGRPAVDQTQRQDGEPVGEAGRIQCQGHTSTAPALEDPGQQRREAGGDVEFAAPLARLGGGRLVSRAGVLFPCYSVWSRNTTYLHIYLLRCVYVLEFN